MDMNTTENNCGLKMKRTISNLELKELVKECISLFEEDMLYFENLDKDMIYEWWQLNTEENTKGFDKFYRKVRQGLFSNKRKYNHSDEEEEY
jgi:hypothetical protein